MSNKLLKSIMDRKMSNIAHIFEKELSAKVWNRLEQKKSKLAKDIITDEDDCDETTEEIANVSGVAVATDRPVKPPLGFPKLGKDNILKRKKQHDVKKNAK